MTRSPPCFTVDMSFSSLDVGLWHVLCTGLKYRVVLDKSIQRTFSQKLWSSLWENFGLWIQVFLWEKKFSFLYISLKSLFVTVHIWTFTSYRQILLESLWCFRVFGDLFQKRPIPTYMVFQQPNNTTIFFVKVSDSSFNFTVMYHKNSGGTLT